MSMLSMQIDRLRSCADLYDGTTKPEMAKELQRPYLAQELRKAADTIWELRDDLQRANNSLHDAEHDESVAWDRVRKAESENAKLKALCEWLIEPYRLGAITGEGVDKRWCRETYDGGSYRLRELVVDDG